MTTTDPDTFPAELRELDPDAAAIWDRYGGGVDLDHYPRYVTADSGGGQGCRLLAAGATIPEIVRLHNIVDPDDPGPEDEAARQRRARADLVFDMIIERCSAFNARDLNAMGIATPGVTPEQIAEIIDRPRPPCGAPTRSGRPCTRPTIVASIPCWQHDG